MRFATLALFALVSIAEGASIETPLDEVYRDTLKGNAQLSDGPGLPDKPLGLSPEPAGTAEEGAGNPPSVRCGPELASAPLVIGSRDQFAKIGGLVQSAGMGLLSKALSKATGGAVNAGGGGKEEPQPPLHQDPIGKKFRSRVNDRASGTRMSIGGQMASDGIILSTRLDDAEDKGTVHEIYLERDDCRRIYPFVDYAYELWGKWKLTVSWTKTTSRYQDGKLVDRQTSSGGFERQGQELLASGAGRMPLSEALAKAPPDLQSAIGSYQARLLEEAGPPLWTRLGFGAPTSGARAVGAAFKLSAADLQALEAGRMHAIVQVTRVRGPVYEAVGVPVSLAPSGEGHLRFASLGGK